MWRSRLPIKGRLTGRLASRVLGLLDVQTRNAAEIPQVGGHDRVAQFQSRRSDEQIRQRKIDPPCSLFTADPGNDLRSLRSHRLNWDGGLQFVQKGAAAFAKLRCVGPINPVADLGDGHGG